MLCPLGRGATSATVCELYLCRAARTNAEILRKQGLEAHPLPETLIPGRRADRNSDIVLKGRSLYRLYIKYI